MSPAYRWRGTFKPSAAVQSDAEAHLMNDGALHLIEKSGLLWYALLKVRHFRDVYQLRPLLLYSSPAEDRVRYSAPQKKKVSTPPKRRVSKRLKRWSAVRRPARESTNKKLISIIKNTSAIASGMWADALYLICVGPDRDNTIIWKQIKNTVLK